MDHSSYKDHTTTRGLTYHYFSSPATTPHHPTVLFLHGFPSTSADWHRIVPHFLRKGYGVLAPDLLGYGRTDKPEDAHAFRWSLMTKDIIDILDAEHVHKAIAIGHGWGSALASRLSNYFPERFIAYAFLAVSYTLPGPGINAADLDAAAKKLVGRELYGYWFYFAAKGTDAAIENNYGRFQSILWPADPDDWKRSLCPSGATKEWLTGDSKEHSSAVGSYLTPEEVEAHRRVLLSGGFASPLNWYKITVLDVSGEDDKKIPLENYHPKVPVFFGAAAKDYICVDWVGKENIVKQCKGPNTIKEYDADHWLVLSHAEQLSKDLLSWIEGF